MLNNLKAQANSAFSLVELMAVVAILGILGMYAFQSAEYFKYRAMQVQAKLLINMTKPLLTAFMNDRGRLPDFADGSWGAGSAIGGALYLTNADVSTETSCQVANPLGFKIGNCKRNYYNIRLSVSTADPGHYGIRAEANTNFHPSGSLFDVWAGCPETPICNLHDITFNKLDLTLQMQELLASNLAGTDKYRCRYCGWGWALPP